MAWLVGLDWLHWLCAVRLIWTCRGSHTYSLSWLALAIFTLLLARRPGAWLRLGIGLTVLIVGFDGAVWAMNRPLKLLAVGLIAALAPPVVPFLLAGLRDLARSLADYPARGGVRPHAAALLFVGGPVLLLGLLHRPTRPAPDGAPVVPTVVRMLVAGERDLTAYTTFRFGYWLHIRDTGLPHFVSRRPGGIYSQYPAGMELFALPAVLYAADCGVDVCDPSTHLGIEKLAAHGVAALLCSLFFLLARHLASVTACVVVTLLLALGSSVFSTVSQGLWQHGGVSIWLLVALLAEFRDRGQNRPSTAIVQGVAVALMLTCRLSAGLFVGVAALWIVLRSPWRGLLTAVVAGLAYLPWAIMYLSIYGQVWGPSVGQMNAFVLSDVPGQLLGVLASPGRGLFVYQPWLLLALAWGWSHRGEPASGANPPGWALVVGVMASSHLLLLATWKYWWGGHCWGSRLATEILPLLALLTLPAVERLLQIRAGRFVLAGLFGLSLAVQAPGVWTDSLLWNVCPVDVDVQPERLWDWSDPPFFFAYQHVDAVPPPPAQ